MNDHEYDVFLNRQLQVEGEALNFHEHITNFHPLIISPIHQGTNSAIKSIFLVFVIDTYIMFYVLQVLCRLHSLILYNCTERVHDMLCKENIW